MIDVRIHQKWSIMGILWLSNIIFERICLKMPCVINFKVQGINFPSGPSSGVKLFKFLRLQTVVEKLTETPFYTEENQWIYTPEEYHY